jgi:hypothetical protein
MFKVPNEYRVQNGELGSTDEIGNNGAFLIPFESFTLRVIASDGEGWSMCQCRYRTAVQTGARCASSRMYSGTLRMW